MSDLVLVTLIVCATLIVLAWIGTRRPGHRQDDDRPRSDRDHPAPAPREPPAPPPPPLRRDR